MEIGSILEGTVTRIAPYGAFVALREDGEACAPKTGMVHISELSERFVKDINAFVSVGDVLRVKVLAVDERGRISLSVKQARTEEEIAAERAQIEAERAARIRERREAVRAAQETGIPDEYTPYIRNQKPSSGDAFEDMMSRFKTISDEKISDLRRYTDGKRSSGSGGHRK